MKRAYAIVGLMVFIGAGCAAPRCEESRMKEMIVTGGKYHRVYQATEDVLQKYFEIAYADPACGVITTRYSQEKSPEEAIVKISAIAAITEGKLGPHINLKVVKQRFLDKWDVWGHNIIEEEVFIGADRLLEDRILNEIEQALSGSEAKPSAALPMPMPAPAPVAPAK